MHWQKIEFCTKCWWIWPLYGLSREAESDDENLTGNGNLSGPGNGSWILVKRVKNRRNDAITSRGNHSRNFVGQSKNYSIVFQKCRHTYYNIDLLILYGTLSLLSYFLKPMSDLPSNQYEWTIFPAVLAVSKIQLTSNWFKVTRKSCIFCHDSV